MREKIATLLLFIGAIVPTLAFADFPAVRNDSAATTIAPSNGGASLISVDNKGRLFTSVDPTSGLASSVIPISTATNLNGMGVGLIGWGLVVTDTAETGTTTTVINATAHSAKVGDIIWVNSGSAARQWSPVSAVAANTITVSNAFTVAPVNGDQFFIQRPIPIASTNNTNLSAQSLATFLDSNYQQSAATGILKPEDSASASGDAGVAALGVQNSAYATLSADGDYTALAVGRAGNNFSTMVFDDLLPLSRQVSKLEDSASTSGDAGIQIFGISDLSNAVGNFTSSDGDYVPWKLTRGGIGNVQMNTLYTASAEKPTSLLKNEDDATASADAGVAIFGKLQAAISADAADGDYGLPKLDTGGRQIITNAPSGSMVVGCASVTTATTGTMVAALASNYTFITQWNCTNTGGAASRVILEDGDGADLANLFLPATSGSQSISFPSPVRTNTTNKVIQINVLTTGTATICCASGYYGVI